MTEFRKNRFWFLSFCFLILSTWPAGFLRVTGPANNYCCNLSNRIKKLPNYIYPYWTTTVTFLLWKCDDVANRLGGDILVDAADQSSNTEQGWICIGELIFVRSFLNDFFLMTEMAFIEVRLSLLGTYLPEWSFYIRITVTIKSPTFWNYFLENYETAVEKLEHSLGNGYGKILKHFETMPSRAKHIALRQ